MITKIGLLTISFNDYYSRLQKAESRVMALALPYFSTKKIINDLFKACWIIPIIGMVNFFAFTGAVITPDILPLKDVFKKFLLNQRNPIHPFSPIFKIYKIGCFILFSIKVFCIGIISPKKLRSIDSFTFRKQDADIKKPETLKEKEQDLSPDSEEQTSLRGFSSVIGMDALKTQVFKACPQLFSDSQTPIANGILLYGPPGCGKSFIAKKFAEEVEIRLKKKIPVFRMNIGDLKGEYMHETAINIGKVFSTAAADAKKSGTIAILIIDEIDGFVAKMNLDEKDYINSLVCYQDEKGVFLQNLERAAKNNILCIATTNNPGLLDDAIKRSGRFDLQFEVPLPDQAACHTILKDLLKNRPHDPSINFELLGKVISDLKLSTAEIQTIVVQAATIVFLRCSDLNEMSSPLPITYIDICEALKNYLRERDYPQLEECLIYIDQNLNLN